MQTPTLAMLAERDTKITLFHKEKYHLLRLKLDGAEAVSEKFTDPAEAEQAAAMCKGAVIEDREKMCIRDRDGEKAETPIVCTCTEKCQAGAVNTACPVCVKNLSECVGAEQ